VGNQFGWLDLAISILVSKNQTGTRTIVPCRFGTGTRLFGFILFYFLKKKKKKEKGKKKEKD
jgi:hypothetical protein